MDQEDIHERFKLAVESGNLSEVSKLLKSGKCDVNKRFKYGGDDYFENFPLSFSLTKIKTLNDEHYQISCLLLNEKDINVNIGNVFRTILSRLCEEKHPSLHGAGSL